jgi:hypothetical protein
MIKSDSPCERDLEFRTSFRADSVSLKSDATPDGPEKVEPAPEPKPSGLYQWGIQMKTHAPCD